MLDINLMVYDADLKKSESLINPRSTPNCVLEEAQYFEFFTRRQSERIHRNDNDSIPFKCLDKWVRIISEDTPARIEYPLGKEDP